MWMQYIATTRTRKLKWRRLALRKQPSVDKYSYVQPSVDKHSYVQPSVDKYSYVQRHVKADRV
jgi:hypothetical protein